MRCFTAAQTVSPFFHEKTARQGRGTMGNQFSAASASWLKLSDIDSQRPEKRVKHAGTNGVSNPDFRQWGFFAHCDAALSLMVSVENAGKLSERPETDESAG